MIFFVRPLHSKPGMESYCQHSTDQLNYHGRPMLLKSVSSDWAVVYELSSLCSDMFYIL